MVASLNRSVEIYTHKIIAKEGTLSYFEMYHKFRGNSQGEIGLIVCQERNWIFSRKDNFDQKEALWRI